MANTAPARYRGNDRPDLRNPLMAHRIATLALGPLLFLQGLHVRRTTPRLPEPAGLRRGEAGQGAPLRLLVTGDSAAAGVGATVQAEALAGRLVEALAAHYRVRWELVATTGHTTADTLRVLQALPAERFDIAVTSLGVNDVTALHGTRRWLREQAALADLLRSKFGVRRVLLSALPPVHRFPALPQPLRWYLGARARHFNRTLAAWAATSAACTFTAMDYPLQPALMAADGFHPGPGAYTLWGQHLAAEIIRCWPAPS